MPYRTRQNVIEGVVVSFVDVTELKQAQETLQRVNAELARSASSLLAVGRPEGRLPGDAVARTAQPGWRDCQTLERR